MTDYEPSRPSIKTATGVYFCYTDDDGVGIDLKSIAHALALTCRFAGHVRSFYSVAQHSVIVSRLVPAEHRAWAMLHDGAEAYLPDVPRPAKTILPDYCALEDRVLARIAREFGLAGTSPPAEVKHADLVALAAEARDMHGIADPVGEWGLPVSRDEVDDVATIEPLRWQQAEHVFLNRAHEVLNLTGDA